jgi:hypothetical protein
MSLYRVMIFVHVLSMVGMFSALALEGLSLFKVRRAVSVEQAREWTGVWNLVPPLGMSSLFGTLGTGIYLATTMGGWELSWIQVAFPSLVLVAVAGAIVGPRRGRAAKSLESGVLRAAVKDPLFAASWSFRLMMLSGVLYAMTVRPAKAWPVVMVAGMAGVVLAGRAALGQPAA